jgi:hypothetical protein
MRQLLTRLVRESRTNNRIGQKYFSSGQEKGQNALRHFDLKNK